MSNIVDKIKSIKDVSAIKGCTTAQIREAQEILDLVFPDEYIEYVKAFGCIDFGSTEWTGLNIQGRLNTVTATQQEKSVNNAFPKKSFVLEDLAIDAKKIVVDEDGKVYLLQYEKASPLCDSITEYLDMCIKKNR